MSPAAAGRTVRAMNDTSREAAWEAPGRGQWHREVAHFPRGQTPVYRTVYAAASAAGLASSFRRYGVPVSHLEMRHVNDLAYVRPVPLVEPPSHLAGRRPPSVAVWLLSRLAPELRRRAKVAAEAWDGRRWRDDARRWSDELKPAVERANLALQDEFSPELDQLDLAAHVERALANLRAGITTHFELVAPNIVPVGAFIDAAARAGVRPDDALSLLAGSSPGSAAGVTELAAVARAVAGAGRAPATLDELRATGEEVAAALAAWLRRYGHRVLTSCDVDRPTLVELPDVVLRTALAVAAGHGADRPPPADTVLDAAPSARRAELEDLLAEARVAYALRDDNASTTLSWPSGLLRRAFLAAGARLVGAGRLASPVDVFELQPDEVLSVMRGAPAPAADEVRRRRERRASNVAAAATAPRTLGPDEPLPSLDPLPRPLRRVGRAVLTAYELMNTATAGGVSVGAGVGTATVRGRARVASSAEEALLRLEPGDVLVVPFTTPAYNAVLPLAAGLVVEEGGALSHAALVARELGVPAVIGVPGIVERIADGAEIEVDPLAGTVTVLVEQAS